MTKAQVACSFCERSQADVGRLLEGAGAYICDGCIDAAAEILAADPPPRADDGSASGSAKGPIPSEAVDAARAALAERLVGHEAARRALLAALRHHDVCARADEDEVEAPMPPRLLFVGGRGVGKTALCQALCAVVDPYPTLHWEMGGMMAKAYERGELANLAQAITRRSGSYEASLRAILCLDGVEALDGSREAARAQRDLLLILDGVAQAHQFASNTMMIVATMRLDQPGDAPDDEDALREHLAAGVMLPSLVARFDRVIALRVLDATALRTVLEHERGPLAEARRVAAGCGIALAFSEGARAALVAYALRGETGAWGLRRGTRRVLDEAVLSRNDVTRVTLEEADVWAVLPPLEA